RREAQPPNSDEKGQPSSRLAKLIPEPKTVNELVQLVKTQLEEEDQLEQELGEAETKSPERPGNEVELATSIAGLVQKIQEKNADILDAEQKVRKANTQIEQIRRSQAKGKATLPGETQGTTVEVDRAERDNLQ
ncbi:unnamed protein product, partial [Amoebophrya sp. A25]